MHSPYRSRLIGCTILLFVFTSLVGASSASADVPGPITTRVLAILDGAGSGTTGMYLKEVGGPVIAAHAENFQFAPASTIKVLLHLYAHDQVQRGNAAYTDQVNHYSGAADGCPKDAVKDGTEDLIVSAERMMTISDNPATRANYEHWSPAPATINAYATSIGLTSTAFMNSPGCPLGLANVDGNTATLTDYGRLYEGVANGTLLSGSFRDSFYATMNSTNSVLVDMVRAEEPAGMPDELRNDFLEGMTATHKGGSYNVCSGTSCNRWRAWAGWARFPTCEAGSFSSRSYVWGAFIHNATDSAGGGTAPAETAIRAALAEPLREQLRAALAGWGACYPPDVTVTTTPAAPPAGQDGYFNAANLAANGDKIDVRVSATDDSGVTDLQCTVNGSSVTVGSQAGTNPRSGGFALSADGTHNVVCTARDGMTPANTGASTDADNSVTVKIDATPPTVSCQTPPPIFTWNGAGGTVSAGVSDSTSGPVSASLSAPAVVTSAGAKTVALTGRDKAGNSTTADCAYLVAYLFLGFDSPLEVERIKSGSTIPVKFAFGDASGAPMSDSEGVALAAACAVRISFTGGNPSPDCATYNPDANRFEFRLKTAKGTLGLHTIVVRVLDGVVVLNTESTQVFLVR
ncbi:MAG TPA: serine hydrolase [Gaiellaceae bacterium]|nr:serine hydrolase [Gaiellaceae bacterium]